MTFVVNYLLNFAKLILMLALGLVTINGFNSTLDNIQKLTILLLLASWSMVGLIFGMIIKYFINKSFQKRRLKMLYRYALGLLLGFVLGWTMIQFLESIKLGFEYVIVPGQKGLLQNLFVMTIFGTHLYDQEKAFRY
jgi:hypothetical protein